MNPSERYGMCPSTLGRTRCQRTAGHVGLHTRQIAWGADSYLGTISGFQEPRQRRRPKPRHAALPVMVGIILAIWVVNFALHPSWARSGAVLGHLGWLVARLELTSIYRSREAARAR